MQEKRSVYITTAIDYVNARPHIGHALEKIQADVLARYFRAEGYDTRFLTGTDENSLKNVLAAKEVDEETETFVAKNAEVFKDLGRALNLTWDDFIRTTEGRHILGVNKFWQACKSEDIYKKAYKGLYCVGCEEFKTEKEIADGKCPEHPNRDLETVEEENYFFRLSAYADTLKEKIFKNEILIVPESRKNEMLSFIDQGLEDFSISRSIARAEGWGIPVPGDETQVIYVWFDALLNYITALGYGSEDESKFKKYWGEGESIHVIGKGITRFHAIYWPAMLLSAELPLPNKIFSHGYLTIDGQKISKSLGNVVDPFEVAEKYGADALRYFLLRESSPYEDGDFSVKKLEERYNGELANGLGNLVARVSALGENISPIAYTNSTSIEKSINDAKSEAAPLLGAFKFNEALERIHRCLDQANVALNVDQPWYKEGQERADKIESRCAELFVISKLLDPFLPRAAQSIREQIAYDPEKRVFNVKKGAALFPRLQ